MGACSGLGQYSPKLARKLFQLGLLPGVACWPKTMDQAWASRLWNGSLCNGETVPAGPNHADMMGVARTSHADGALSSASLLA